MNGLSLMFCVGKWSRPRIEFVSGICRITLGPFSAWFCLVDMDNLFLFILNNATLKDPEEE